MNRLAITFNVLLLSTALAIPIRAQDPGAPEGPKGAGAAGSVADPSASALPPFVLRPGVPSPGRTTIHYAPRAGLLATPYGFFPYAPPIVVLGGGFGYPPIAPSPIPPPVLGPPGLMLPPPRPPGARAGNPIIVVENPDQDRRIREAAARRPLRGDPDRAAELMTIGDRLFRADNLVRATSRYKQALQADPLGAAPRIRLSQVALRRGEYRDAANLIREAITAEPEWLINAQDIQGVYAEPADFHAEIARLETHLQAQPHDRDAWLVLGAQLYLSQRNARAADIFLRLTDRPPDATLTAFLEATRARQ